MVQTNSTPSAIQSDFPLSSKKPIKKTIEAMTFWWLLGFLAVLGLLVVPLYFPSYYTGISLGVTLSWILLIIVTIIQFFYQVIYYRTYKYDITDRFVIIRKGVIMPREITIPFERIQDVYVDQDFYDRMLGLYDVHISSATFSSWVLAHIDGVASESSNGLRNVLLTKIQGRPNS